MDVRRTWVSKPWNTQNNSLVSIWRGLTQWRRCGRSMVAATTAAPTNWTIRIGLFNTRGVYKGDDDDQWIAQHPEIQRIADAIEQRRMEMGKNSGFERMYPRVTKLYFGGMARHLAELRTVLRPGAQLAYVVGDQASYLRVMIRTGQLIADIAQALGYELVRVDLFRTRLATATREQLREEVVVLRWRRDRSV